MHRAMLSVKSNATFVSSTFSIAARVSLRYLCVLLHQFAIETKCKSIEHLFSLSVLLYCRSPSACPHSLVSAPCSIALPPPLHYFIASALYANRTKPRTEINHRSILISRPRGVSIPSGYSSESADKGRQQRWRERERGGEEEPRSPVIY